MRTSSIEQELTGTLRYLDRNQKMDVLSFINEKLGVSEKIVTKSQAIKDIRTALKSDMAF